MIFILNNTSCPVCNSDLISERGLPGAVSYLRCNNSYSIKDHTWSISSIPDGTVNYVEFFQINDICVHNFVGQSKESYVVFNVNNDADELYSDESSICPVVKSMEEFKNYMVLK